MTDKQLSDYQQWRADRIDNATNPDTGEDIPADTRAGDTVTINPSVQTSRGSGSRKS